MTGAVFDIEAVLDHLKTVIVEGTTLTTDNTYTRFLPNISVYNMPLVYCYFGEGNYSQSPTHKAIKETRKVLITVVYAVTGMNDHAGSAENDAYPLYDSFRQMLFTNRDLKTQALTLTPYSSFLFKDSGLRWIPLATNDNATQGSLETTFELTIEHTIHLI